MEELDGIEKQSLPEIMNRGNEGANPKLIRLRKEMTLPKMHSKFRARILLKNENAGKSKSVSRAWQSRFKGFTVS